MSEAAETLAAVIAAKPGGEQRPGQEAMCLAVDAAFASGEHLLVEAPTGVGKSLAYLAPAVSHARSAPVTPSSPKSSRASIPSTMVTSSLARHR